MDLGINQVIQQKQISLILAELSMATRGHYKPYSYLKKPPLHDLPKTGNWYLKLKSLTRGVPQGSFSGPLRFLKLTWSLTVYMRGLCAVDNSVYCPYVWKQWDKSRHVHADDTTGR